MALNRVSSVSSTHGSDDAVQKTLYLSVYFPLFLGGSTVGCCFTREWSPIWMRWVIRLGFAAPQGPGWGVFPARSAVVGLVVRHIQQRNSHRLSIKNLCRGEEVTLINMVKYPMVGAAVQCQFLVSRVEQPCNSAPILH